MALFTPAFDRALGCDAYLIDTERPARLLQLSTEVSPELVVGPLLDRTVLMGKSPFEVRGMTFALFVGAGDPFAVAVTEPVAEGAVSMLRDTLAAFGPVADSGVRLEEAGLAPLLAYEEGRVSFFDSAATRAWRRLAGNRGLRILAATTSHDFDPDVEIRSCVP